MATRYAISAGNFSDTAIWSDSSGGAGGFSVPVGGDNVYANAFVAVQVDQNVGSPSNPLNSLNALDLNASFELKNGFTVYTTNAVAENGGKIRASSSGLNNATLNIVGGSLIVKGTGQVLGGGAGMPGNLTIAFTADSPAEDDVRDGVDYDYGGSTGNLVVPNVSDVRSGTTFDSSSGETGTLNASVATSGVISG